MTKCTDCGHDNKLHISPQDREFIINNAPEESNFSRALIKFANEYESMKNKIAYAAVVGETPNRTLVETFRYRYNIMVNIDIDSCDCGECEE